MVPMGRPVVRLRCPSHAFAGGLPCGRPLGHEGRHKALVLWDDDPVNLTTESPETGRTAEEADRG